MGLIQSQGIGAATFFATGVVLTAAFATFFATGATTLFATGVATFFATGVATFFATGVATLFATGVATLFATGVATLFATGAATLFATGAVFTAAFSTFSSCVGRWARAVAVKDLHVNDVAIEGDSREFWFAGDSQAGRYFLSRAQVSQPIGAKLSHGLRSRLQVRLCLYVAKVA